MNEVYIKSYDLPQFNFDEILRYAGVHSATDEISSIILECMDELSEIKGRVCYCTFPIFSDGNSIDLSFAKTESKDLKKNLKNCNSIIVFASTIGIEIDRFIRMYSSISPVKALIFQAIGTERIETLCDTFCNDISSHNKVHPRFSPGYGDLPLELQKDIFKVLDCSKKIGVSINDSLLMTPTKSVTAIIGIENISEKVK